MEMQLFSHQKLGSVRVIIKDGEPWFVAMDVCEILGVRTDNLNKTLKNDEFCRLGRYPYTIGVVNDSNGLRASTILISESGLYRLIMVSRKKEADAFRTWAAKEVFPSIRKTGQYTLQQKLPTTFDIPKTLPDALRAYALEVEKNEELRIAIEIANGDRDKAIAQRAAISSSREASAIKRIGIQAKQIDEYAKRYREMDAERRDLRDRIAALTAERADVQAKLEALQSADAGKLSDYDAYKLKEYKRKVADLTNRSANLEELLDEANEELRAAREEATRARHTADSHEEAVRGLTMRNEELLKENQFLRTNGSGTTDTTLEEALRTIQELRIRMGEDTEYHTLQTHKWHIDSHLSVGYNQKKCIALNKISQELGYPVRKLEVPMFGSITAWHKDVFRTLEERQIKNNMYINTFSPEYVYKKTKGKR